MKRRMGRYAPWPLVGVTILLVVLILLTPVLISSGQPAPGVLTQAELIVDRIAGVGETHFYIRGLGSTTRYADIWVGGTSNFRWDGTSPLNWSALRFSTFWNDTNVLSVEFATFAPLIALNITAYYQSPAGDAVYAGELAFLAGPSPSGGGEVLYAASATSGVTVSGQIPVDNSTLPLLIVLAHVFPGSLP